MAAAPAVTRPPSAAGSESAPEAKSPAGSPSRLTLAGLVVAVLGAIGFRLFTRSELWLDEALTVNIATLPLGDLVDALRRDGAPPLYYVILHGWAALFGTGDVAVRLLSAVFGLATVPLVFKAGRRLGGPVVGAGALVLLCASPFAIRYSTEARQYALVIFLVTAGYLALHGAIARPGPRQLLLVGLLAGALLLTHYWAFYLVGVTFLALLVFAWRRPDARPDARPAALRSAVAIAVGSVLLFGPWVPHFLYQQAHTGTPWGTAPGPVEVAFTTLVDLGGGPFAEGQALAGLLAALALLALLGRAVDERRIELDLRTRPGVRTEAVVGALSLLIAVGVGTLNGSAFASRYTSIVFPLVLLTAAYGLRTLADRRVVIAVLALAALLGFVGGVRNVVFDRTQAPQVADLIAANGGRPGDLVVYCPDQLGPAVERVLPQGYRQLTFPDLADPSIVNWVDYGERMAAADPVAFGNEILRRSGGRNIWYVWMPGYRTLDKQCERINETFGNARPGNRQLLEPDVHTFERQVLWLHPESASA